MRQKTDDVAEVIRRLASQFTSNMETALSKLSPELARVELKARCLSSVGDILRCECALSETHKEIAGIYDEIFADSICSLYLAAQGLDKPAQVLLRRALELGVAATFLWDCPNVYWGWKVNDKDLSFTEMTDQLADPSYLRFVASENGRFDASPIYDVTLARKEYRSLSNTVHGKIATFETTLADSFRHSGEDWVSHIARLEAIQDLILNLAQGRFAKVREKLPIVQPQLITIK